MKHSLTYYITLFAIQLKGIKKSFSQDPVDVEKIRKEDVRNPKGRFFKNNVLQKFNVLDSVITEIGVNANSDQLLLCIHGGAFISGPAQHHWDTMKTIAQRTNFKIWLCDYPKAPEYTITTVSKNIDEIDQKALQNYDAKAICCIGDSVGATLITALMQRMVLQKKEVPRKIILVCPVMDASMSNPAIDTKEKIDPMLSKIGILSAKKMCVGDVDLKDSMISPLYGSFQGFPPTVLCMGQNDIMYPDEKLALDKLQEANVAVEIIEGVDMPHIWPFLPVMKEGKMALEKIIKALLKQSPFFAIRTKHSCFGKPLL